MTFKSFIAGTAKHPRPALLLILHSSLRVSPFGVALGSAMRLGGQARWEDQKRSSTCPKLGCSQGLLVQSLKPVKVHRLCPVGEEFSWTDRRSAAGVEEKTQLVGQSRQPPEGAGLRLDSPTPLGRMVYLLEPGLGGPFPVLHLENKNCRGGTTPPPENPRPTARRVPAAPVSEGGPLIFSLALTARE